MRRAIHRARAPVAFTFVLVMPVVVIVTFWGNGGWSQDSAPVWWWVLASVSAGLAIANSWTRHRDRLKGVEPPATREDAPAALRVWWLFGETLVYVLWLGLAIALVVLGSALGLIIGAVLLLAFLTIAARLARHRVSSRL
jgi:hypothetical protein